MSRSFLLALNSAEGLLQLALGEDSPQGARLVWHESLPAASQGVELLVPALARGLAAVGTEPASIRRIACVSGPGGFTGLRLASATAAGLAAAVGAAQAGLPLLPLLAANAAEITDAGVGTVAVLTYARRSLVYLQVFQMEAGRPRALTGILVLEPHAAARQVLAIDAGALLLGSGLTRNPQAVEELSARALGPEADHPAPEILLRAADALVFGPDPVTPLYVRASDAEDNLPALAAAMGLDPDEAVAALRKLDADSGASP